MSVYKYFYVCVNVSFCGHSYAVYMNERSFECMLRVQTIVYLHLNVFVCMCVLLDQYASQPYKLIASDGVGVHV